MSSAWGGHECAEPVRSDATPYYEKEAGVMMDALLACKLHVHAYKCVPVTVLRLLVFG